MTARSGANGGGPVPAEPAERQKLAFLRVTVLGSAGCGKSSLVNVFVNNFCPQVAQPTDEPTLYYKTLGLPSKESANSQDQFPVLVEIEDTYATSRQDGEDRFGLKRDIKQFMHVFPEGDEKGADADPAVGQLGNSAMPKIDKYAPLTRNRMAFLVVFDGSDEESFKKAEAAHRDIEFFIQLKKVRLRPVVYLVANKSDKGSKAVQAAKDYQESKKDTLRPIVEVSAFEVRRVKKLFRDMLCEVRDNELLWKLDWDGDDGGGAASESRGPALSSVAGNMNGQNCILQ